MFIWTFHFNRNNDNIKLYYPEMTFAAEEVMGLVWLMSVLPNLMCFMDITNMEMTNTG